PLGRFGDHYAQGGGRGGGWGSGSVPISVRLRRQAVPPLGGQHRALGPQVVVGDDASAGGVAGGVGRSRGWGCGGSVRRYRDDDAPAVRVRGGDVGGWCQGERGSGEGKAGLEFCRDSACWL